MEKQTNTNFRRFCATTGGRMGERERKHSCCPGFRADPFRQTFLRVDERLPEALPFLFAVFAHFTVKITTDTPFEFHEPRTTRRVQTKRNRSYKLSRFSRLSRLGLQRTLLLIRSKPKPLKALPLFSPKGWLDTPFFSFLEQQGTLPFLFAVFACFAVRISADTPVENHEP